MNGPPRATDDGDTQTPQIVRFSVAPTGGLHLGSARTALFNWLVARRSGGSFIVSIEDTDAEQGDARYEASILEDLAWLGLDWDEGPGTGGPSGPYRRSERAAQGLYATALERLRLQGTVYRCFCTEEDLARSRARDEASALPPRYRGPCGGLPQAEAQARAQAGERPAWRFRVPPGEAVSFFDTVHGPMTFEREAIGDFVVVRSDGTPVQDLAAAVDDATMGVTYVIRGDDHLSNAPRQILLARALGAPEPRFAHVPLVNGPDGRPLSMSRGAVSVAALREAGYLPEAIVNHVARLGWSDPLQREVLSRDDLAEVFDLARVGRAAATSDPDRLDWLDQQHIRAIQSERFERLVGSLLPAPLPVWFDLAAFSTGVRSEITTLHDAIRLAEPLLEPRVFDQEADDAVASAAGRVAISIAAASLEAGLVAGADIASSVRRDLEDAGLPVCEGLPAVRAALTGRASGLPVALIVDVVGAVESRLRLRAATM